ncbi:hypothetical protein KKB71_02950 [Patescibacteria group bacterium]|nr:hypothetical protein [Patescibacteria group bacterium]
MLKFSEALEKENIDEAVSYLRASIREDYKNAFYQAQKDGILQEIANLFKSFEEKYINDDTAEFIIKYEKEGKTLGSPVILMRDIQGHWKIHSF